MLGMLGIIGSPLPLVIACNPVEGVLTYKVIGENKDKTDYIVDVEVNNQFIAKIVSDNRDNKSNIDSKLKEEILNRIKSVYPSSYKTSRFRKMQPSIRPISRNKYKILFPIRVVTNNMPKISKIQSYLNSKYNRKEEIQKIEDKQKTKIYMPDSTKINNDQKRKEFFKKFYLPKNDADQVAKNDYVNFNYLGVAPYMAKKLTDKILKETIGLKKFTSVSDFLEKNFDGKKGDYKVKLEVTLPNDFPITNFRNTKAEVFFHIKNLQKKDRATKKYKDKAKDEVFNSSSDDKADVYFSLFLKKDLNVELDINKPLEVKSTNKIAETSYDKVFKELSVGKQISRVIEIDATKSKYQFTYSNNKGYNEKQLADAIESKLFEKKAKDQPTQNSEKLYSAEPTKKYKAIATFDINKIESFDKSKKVWNEKLKGSKVEIDDRVTISNFKVQYLGLPFERGAAINHEASNGYSGFIATFDKQMEEMTISKQKTIIPIFPENYNTQTLASKLVKFIIKINEIRKRRPFNSAILTNGDLKNKDNKKIKTAKELNDFAIETFKTSLYNEVVNEYLAKIEVKIPFVLVESIYTQVFVEMFQRTKKRPKQEEVIKAAEQKAKAKELIEKFFGVNQIKGENLEKKRKNLENILFNNIK